MTEKMDQRDSFTPTAPAHTGPQKHVRLRAPVSRALVALSHQLATSDAVDLAQVLAGFGPAIGAQRMYLVIAGLPPGGKAIRYGRAEDMQPLLVTWPAAQAGVEDPLPPAGLDPAQQAALLADASQRTTLEEQTGLVLTALAAHDRPLGYLAAWCPRDPHHVPKEDRHALSILGDLLTGYLKRSATELALQGHSERWNRFVETTTEAIWLVDLEKPVAVEAHREIQVRHILRHGILRECNKEMARLLGVAHVRDAIGQTLEAVLPAFDQAFVEELVRAGYRLDHYALAVQPDDRPPRHLFVNAAGTVERGCLRRIWCSCIDVTDRVEMERSIVTMLEEQQERIGRDLHDSIGQLLTGIRMLSNNLTARYVRKADEGYKLASKVTRFAEEASQRLREILRGLAPPLVYQEDLTVALADLASGIHMLSDDITCTFAHDGRTHVAADEIKLQLYRIAQEATNNALKHARAKHIQISLRREVDRVLLQIQDDGIGFDPEAHPGKPLGFGMANMMHRAQSIRAELLIDSNTAAGTTITCSVRHPLRTNHLACVLLAGALYGQGGLFDLGLILGL